MVESFDIFFDVVFEKIFDKFKFCFFIVVKVIVGFCLIGKEKLDKIFEVVCYRIEIKYFFFFVFCEENGVVIMDGFDEGVYVWIMINYFFGKIGGLDYFFIVVVFDFGGGFI